MNATSLFPDPEWAYELPTGEEAQGFEGAHRLAAFLMLAELVKAGVTLESDDAVVPLAQFVANWERRGERAAIRKCAEVVRASDPFGAWPAIDGIARSIEALLGPKEGAKP